jgi:hypothetical protein
MAIESEKKENYTKAEGDLKETIRRRQAPGISNSEEHLLEPKFQGTIVGIQKEL